MRRYLPIIVVIVIILVVAGFFLSRKDNKTSSSNQVSNSSDHSDMGTSSNSSTQQSKSTQTPQSTSQISIASFAFSPDKTTVKVGTKVTWTNNDSVSHTVTSDTGNTLNSSTLSKGDSFSFTFDQAGTYSYHCNIHPSMKAMVVVVQ